MMQSNQKFWMVMNDDTVSGDTPKSLLPKHRHMTKDGAYREAERLANQYAGQAFVVLEALAVVSVAKSKWTTLENPVPF